MMVNCNDVHMLKAPLPPCWSIVMMFMLKAPPSWSIVMMFMLKAPHLGKLHLSCKDVHAEIPP